MQRGSTVQLPRLEKALEVLRRHNIKSDALLDLGCGGSITAEIARAVSASKV
ncbi:MAG: hypothetical protein LM577_04510 [Thermoproteaceae archaeon]|nr:hypothetical protein [Thermoproteaceae archaeon]